MGSGLLAALEWMLGAGLLTTPRPGPVDFVPREQRTEVRRWVVGGLEEVATALAAQDPAAEVTPVQRLDDGFGTASVYLPSIGGRAMLWWFAEGDAEVALNHDESAPADVVDRVVSVLDRHAAAGPA